MTHQTDCRRCGACCRKGGPTFHLEDRHLIDEGRIPAKYLFTVRCGEPAHENILGRVVPVETDLIKIKGKNGTWTCFFLEEEENRCGIYTDRPAECRALKCWDPRDITRIYRHRRLTRRDLLAPVAGLWELVETHQERCDYARIRRLATTIRKGSDPNARNQLMEIITYDTQIRTLSVQQGGLDKELTDFLFGRPLTVTLPPVLGAILPSAALIF